MRSRGWRSSATLNKTLRSLQRKGRPVVTRQGGRHRASLYALTFWGIDACGGKLDIAANPVQYTLDAKTRQARALDYPVRVESQPMHFGSRASR
jgi:hypothetical protein